MNNADRAILATVTPVPFRRFDPVLRPRRRPRIGVRGRFRLTVLSAGRVILSESDWQNNLFTDIGLERIGAAASFGAFCRIGTGSATPANSDVALQAQAASTATLATGAPNTLTNMGSPDYETVSELTYEFALGALNGNYAEIGLGWSASTASTLATRALIDDGFGSPTTISVSSSQILQVTYQVIAYPDLADSTGTVVIGADTYNYTSRVYSVASARNIQPSSVWLGGVTGAAAYTGNLQAITAAGPAGTSTGLSSGALATYTPGSKTRDFTLSAAIGAGNLSGGIRSIATNLGNGSSVFSTQTEFANTVGGGKIPKDNTKTFTLTMRVSWDRH